MEFLGMEILSMENETQSHRVKVVFELHRKEENYNKITYPIYMRCWFEINNLFEKEKGYERDEKYLFVERKVDVSSMVEESDRYDSL